MEKSTKGMMGAVLALMVTAAGCSSEPASTNNNTGTPSPSASASPAPKTNAKLTFMTNIGGVQFETLDQIAKAFTKETGIAVEAISPGSTYEEMMKTKMAAKDLPDLWTTHGWSVARYSEYLRPLNDQPWASQVSPSIKTLITDKNNQIYVLPMDVDLAGIVYNRDMMKELGIKVEELTTWAKFEQAMEKVKAAGYTPLHIGGKDNWTIGQFFDWVAPSLYTTNDSKNYRDALKNGTFDWKLWREILEMLDRWNKAGYLNKDNLTSDYMATSRGMAAGKVAFGFHGNSVINEVKTQNAKANFGMMHIPAKDESDKPVLIGGEKTAIGVWKNSKFEKEVLQFLTYLAKKENIEKVASSNSLPAGLTGMTSNTGDIAQDYEKFAKTKTISYFDREYLPSGMWDDLCTTGAAVLAGQPGAIENGIKQMEQSYKAKRNQK